MGRVHMDKMSIENDFLSYITPDSNYPDAGIVRITNSKIKYIVKSEGFLDLKDVNHKGVITDEERLVVKIMFNHNSTVLLKRERKGERENDKQLIIYFHEDGIVSCENESSEISVFHCFATVDDLLAYHINDFVSANYDQPKYPFQFLVPTDSTLYREPHGISYSQKLRRAVLQKLRQADVSNSERFQIERSYVDEWNVPQYSLQVHANNLAGEVGFISFLFCKNCIWAIYPYEKNYARVKVMGSAETQNKFCEFICSFAVDGD